jgi:hypothetical protein
MLTESLRKCELSIAYLHTVCAKCGFAISEPRIDNDSVDVMITVNGKIHPDSIRYSPMVHVQLKATTDWEMKNGKFSYFLKLKNYEDLTAYCAVPKILIVLCLPKNEEEWVHHSVDHLILRKCAYWLSLKGAPPTTNESGETVHLQDVFTPDVLKDILIKISKEEW